MPAGWLNPNAKKNHPRHWKLHLIKPINLSKTKHTLYFLENKKKVKYEPVWAYLLNPHELHSVDSTHRSTSTLINKQWQAATLWSNNASPLDSTGPPLYHLIEKIAEEENSPAKDKKESTDKMKVNNRREEHGKARKAAAAKASKQENEKKIGKNEIGGEAPNPNLKPSYPFGTRRKDNRPCGTWCGVSKVDYQLLKPS